MKNAPLGSTQLVIKSQALLVQSFVPYFMTPLPRDSKKRADASARRRLSTRGSLLY